VKAYKGQYIEIPFRGPGWVYLGEIGSRRGVYYDSRQVEDEGMTFVFRADEPGSYSLKFNRQDFIRDYIINDYVQVIVENPPLTSGGTWSNSTVPPNRVYAGPRWPSAEGAPAAAVQVPAAPVAAVQPTVAQGTAEQGSTTEEVSAAIPESVDYLARARAEYDAGRMGGAIENLDQFKIRFPSGSDEAWWLYGQALEANSPSRDIKLSIEYYRRLVNEYPQSIRYDDARRRIAYLERFYFNIQ
jgi:hypothetical protein